MPKPLYDVLLICHVAAAVLGFGSIAVGGAVASGARRSRAPAKEERFVRFFREGTDWPGRLIFLVPALGLTLLLGGDSAAVSSLWPWAGLALWTTAAGLASGLGWPAERRAQREMTALAAGGRGRSEAFCQACARMEVAASATSVLFALAVTLMVWQPRG